MPVSKRSRPAPSVNVSTNPAAVGADGAGGAGAAVVGAAVVGAAVVGAAVVGAAVVGAAVVGAAVVGAAVVGAAVVGAAVVGAAVVGAAVVGAAVIGVSPTGGVDVAVSPPAHDVDGFMPCGTNQRFRLPSEARYPYQQPEPGVQSRVLTPAGASVLYFVVPLTLYSSQQLVSFEAPLAAAA